MTQQINLPFQNYVRSPMLPYEPDRVRKSIYYVSVTQIILAGKVCITYRYEFVRLLISLAKI